MSSAAAASCDDEVRGAVGPGPVRTEERLEVRGRSCLGAPHPGALVAAGASHPALTIRAVGPREVHARDTGGTFCRSGAYNDHEEAPGARRAAGAPGAGRGGRVPGIAVRDDEHGAPRVTSRLCTAERTRRAARRLRRPRRETRDDASARTRLRGRAELRLRRACQGRDDRGAVRAPVRPAARRDARAGTALAAGRERRRAAGRPRRRGPAVEHTVRRARPISRRAAGHASGCVREPRRSSPDGTKLFLIHWLTNRYELKVYDFSRRRLVATPTLESDGSVEKMVGRRVPASRRATAAGC